MASETEESIESGGRGKKRTEERAIHEDGGHGGRVVLDRIAIVGVGRGRVVVKKWRCVEGAGTRGWWGGSGYGKQGDWARGGEAAWHSLPGHGGGGGGHVGAWLERYV